MSWRAESELKNSDIEDEASRKPEFPIETSHRLRVWRQADADRQGFSVKSLIFIAVLIAISALVLYLFGAIVADNLNPAHWTSMQRLVTALLWFVLVGPVVIYIALKGSP